MAELLLDSQIRFWVFLPIVVITFLVGIIRHYATILLSSDKKVESQQVKDGQAMFRSRLLREHGRFIPEQEFDIPDGMEGKFNAKCKQCIAVLSASTKASLNLLRNLLAFKMRKAFFIAEETGFFKTAKREPVMKNPVTDPSMMTDMMKGNLTNVLPMIVIGGWINWAFSGFLTTKVPFPLTLRFKPMLQRGVELSALDAAWVSSASWYFLNVFGLRSMYTLILGQDNAADQTRMMQDQMSGAPMGMQQDMSKAFKAEAESLQLTEHHWALEHAEEELMGMPTYAPETIYLKDKVI